MYKNKIISTKHQSITCQFSLISFEAVLLTMQFVTQFWDSVLSVCSWKVETRRHEHPELIPKQISWPPLSSHCLCSLSNLFEARSLCSALSDGELQDIPDTLQPSLSTFSDGRYPVLSLFNISDLFKQSWSSPCGFRERVTKFIFTGISSLFWESLLYLLDKAEASVFFLLTTDPSYKVIGTFLQYFESISNRFSLRLKVCFEWPNWTELNWAVERNSWES